MRKPTIAEVECEILALHDLRTADLQRRWQEVFGTEPPRYMRAGFLRRAIAYRLQEQVHGGLSTATQRKLQKLALELRRDQSGAAPVAVKREVHLSPGTRLMREWNGATEYVDVVQDGFVWRNETYRTLSAAAVAITGTKWSGPKFFGLDQSSMIATAKRQSRQLMAQPPVEAVS